MKIAIPIGARVFVEVYPVKDSVTERYKAAGLHAVTLESNRPMPTSGKIVAVGSDPLVQETLKVGDIVIFQKHAGSEIQIEGRTLRSLDLHEIITVVRDR